MKKIIMLFVLSLACVGVRSQTLLSRSYDVSPVISYTVFEPQKDTVYYWQINNVNSAKMLESFYLRFRGRNELQRTLKLFSWLVLRAYHVSGSERKFRGKSR